MKIKHNIAFLFLFGIMAMNAQQATVTSGGNATGAGGTVSYSIGQVADKTQTGTTGTITQGVQQPFEIVTLSGEEFENIQLEAIVFPNPTIANVTLKISNFSLENVRYLLFDITGKLLKDDRVSTEETIIDMERYPSATYLLKVNSNFNELKTFKIIKN